jgi:hypothetical protein
MATSETKRDELKTAASARAVKYGAAKDNHALGLEYLALVILAHQPNLVVEFEKMKLIKENRPDLAVNVIWHREDVDNRTPGWDITSFDKNGQELYIEVKASEGQKISDVELTINEWIQAEKNIENNQYKVYLVSDVFSNPIIEVIDNPALMVKKGQLTLNVARYQLLLGVRVD